MLKGFDDQQEPKAVRLLREALSERLGRPAASRAAKGHSRRWYISDPCFAVLQRGAGGSRGYRSGLLVEHGEVFFHNVHSRTAAKLLRANLMARPEALALAAEGTHRLRSQNFLMYSSRKRSDKREWRDHREFVELDDWREFVAYMRENGAAIAKDLFPELPSAGKTGTGTAVRGNDFSLLLASAVGMSEADAEAIVDAAWNLFACLYPWEPMRKRNADLRRFMLSKVGAMSCEHEKIRGVVASRCDDSLVQAAHIIPYALGGSDKPENGLWLCGKHHRETEGKIRGRRQQDNLSCVAVRFIA